MGYCAAVGAARLNARSAGVGGTGDRIETGGTAQRGRGAGAGGAAAQGTMIRMTEAAAGGLDVGLGPVELHAVMVVQQGIQAGQAGAGQQEDCQQEERLGPAEVRSPGGEGAIHVVEYTQVRSTAVLRRTGPSAGRMNQKAAPLP